MEWQRHKPWLQLWVQEMLCREKDGRPTAASSLEHPEVKRALGQSLSCEKNILFHLGRGPGPGCEVEVLQSILFKAILSDY